MSHKLAASTTARGAIVLANHLAGTADAPTVASHSQITSGDLHTDYLLAAGSRALSGNMSAGSNKITSLAVCTADGDAANKAYVDSVAAGLDPKASVRMATTAALPACTYANGTAGVGATLTGNANGALAAQDGITPVAADRILVKDQAAGLQNGIYIVTTLGTGGAPFVLTRSTDCDAAADYNTGAYTFVEEGTLGGGNGYNAITTGAYTLGTTAISWSQFSGAGQITAGDGLTKSANTLAVGAGDGISVASDTVTVNIDGSTLSKGGSGLKVADAGITATQIAAAVAGDGLTGGAGTALAVGAGNGITVNANDVALASTAGGAGLTYTTGVLAVGAGNGITVNADDVALASTAAGAGLTYTTGVLAVGAGNGITVNADDIALATSAAGAGLTYSSGVLAVGAGTGLTVNADDVAVNHGHSGFDIYALKDGSRTFTGTVSPNASGVDLGTTSARWDVFAGDMDMSGAVKQACTAPTPDTAYTVVATDAIVIFMITSATGRAITMPVAVTGRKVMIKLMGGGSGAATITPNGAETIDSASTLVLNQLGAVTLVGAAGTGWMIF